MAPVIVPVQNDLPTCAFELSRPGVQTMRVKISGMEAAQGEQFLREGADAHGFVVRTAKEDDLHPLALFGLGILGLPLIPIFFLGLALFLHIAIEASDLGVLNVFSIPKLLARIGVFAGFGWFFLLTFMSVVVWRRSGKNTAA